MCDYCDCRSHPEIAALSAEHERMLAITSALRRTAGEPAEDATDRAIDELLGELARLLGPHAEREQVGVFGVLRDVEVPDDYVGIFEHDHTEIDAAVSAARGDHDAVPQLIGILEHHIHAEETDMYPAAHQLLAPAHWDELDRRLAAANLPTAS